MAQQPQMRFNDVAKNLRSIQNIKNLTYEYIDKYGDVLGHEMKNNELSVTQLRKIYNIILIHRRNFNKDSLRIIKPLLAYTAARNVKAKALCDLLRSLVDKVNDYEDFEKFYKLMEATLAYYKYYEETEKKGRHRERASYEGWSEDDLR